MAKKKTTVRIEEELIKEAKRRKTKMTPIFENALASTLGFKIERGPRLIKLDNQN